MNQGIFRAICLVACIVSAGCGDGRIATYRVKGQVVFADGTPVRTGTVELQSIEHKITSTGKIQADGTFVLGTYTPDDGAAAGEHRAIVVQLIVNDGLLKHVNDHGAPVDPKYGIYESSDLRATVEANESNEIRLVLNKAGKR